MKKILFIFQQILLVALLSSCRSQQFQERFQERLTHLQEKIDKLNNSERYLAGMTADEIYELREEAVLLALEGGEYHLCLIGSPDFPQAKEKARFFFETVKYLGDKEFRVHEAEIRQTWSALRWAWADLDFLFLDDVECPGFHPFDHDDGWKIWQMVKVIFPGMQGYAAAESVICLLSDLILSWDKEIEGHVDVPSLNPQYVAQAEAGLAALEAIPEIRKK